MRLRRRRSAGCVALAVGLIGLSGCSGLIQGKENGCAEDRMVAYPAHGRGPADLSLKARVTDRHGHGVPNINIIFYLFSTTHGGAGFVASAGGYTDAQGVLSTRLDGYYGKNPYELAEARQAIRYVARYQKGFDIPKHPYCDVSATSTVRYDG